MTEKNFGLSDSLMEEMKDKVNIVYHGAATIKFNTYLGDAIKINLGGFESHSFIPLPDDWGCFFF